MRVAKGDAHSASKTRVTAPMAPPIYCAAMLLARMTSPQSLISRLSSELAASGVCWSGGNSSMPPSSNVLRTVASASAWRSAALSRSTIGPGVPAGANRMCHVWTAPSWQGFSSRLRAGRCSHVFGLLARHTGAAGHNALRGSGPGQNLAFDNALAHVGCPDRRIDRLCITCCSPSQPSHRAGVGTISLRRECDGFLVALTLGHHGPRHPRDLISERDRGDLRWPPRQQCREPGPMFRAMDLG